MRLLTRSGQYLVAEATGSPYIENGKVIGVSGYVRNITARKKVEEELRKREMQLGEVQEIAHIGNWEIEISTNHMTWSDEQLKDKIISMSKMVDTTVQTVRRISGELRPPVLDDFGLTAAI